MKNFIIELFFVSFFSELINLVNVSNFDRSSMLLQFLIISKLELNLCLRFLKTKIRFK